MTEELAGRSYNFPRIESIRYGRGCISGLAHAIEEIGARRVFLVMSPSIKSGPVGSAVTQQIGDRLVGTYSNVVSHVPASNALEAIREARAVSADLIVSAGGGSVLDTAKAVSMAMREPVENEEQLVALRIDGTRSTTPLTAAPVPHIAVPITLGSSEFTHSFTITNSSTQTKDMYWEPRFAPVIAFLDGDLALHTPDRFWASTGMKTIDHCVEWFLSLGHTEFNDALCVSALKMLWENLPASVGDRMSAEARQQCQIAAWMSAYGALNVVGGLSHAIGHHLGPFTGIVHGHTTSLVLPHVVEFNRPATVARQAILARAVGVSAGLDDDAAARELPGKLREVADQLGLPATLRDAGFDGRSLEGVASASMGDPMLRNNPREVREADIERILAALL